MANEIPMKVVQHPQLEDVKYTVPEADVPRWEKQGWKVTEDAPSAPTGEAQVEEDLTVAQKAGLGLLPVAGTPTAEPTSTPTAAQAPTAADAPTVSPTATAPVAPATTSPATAATAPASGTSATADQQAKAGATS